MRRSNLSDYVTEILSEIFVLDEITALIVLINPMLIREQCRTLTVLKPEHGAVRFEQ
jgi:hypothetical protein